jgi:hypothetical protein
MSRRSLTLAALAIAVPVLAGAEEAYRHGRVRHAEAGVSIQRANDPGSEEAVANMPFLPGDRVWSDAQGRAEFQFADGTLLRLDLGSKLDYVAHEEGDDERVILRLWSGSLILHAQPGRQSPQFAVETPGGVMVAQQRGVYRVDADAGETRLSVYEGEATLEAERRLRVRAGERVYARGGEAYGDPESFNRADADDFGRWDADRHAETRVAQDVPEYVPEAIAPYADDLQDHGAWHFDASVGHVWRPYVDAAWQPYQNGRWLWTAYGWTWLPYERWGWAPFHYGRWGYGSGLGWYWVPGRAWGPAWVDWAVGGDHVGWCPTGWRDRDIPGRGNPGGWAVPRGHRRGAWVYARRGDLVARDLPQRVAFNTAVPRHMTLLDARSRVTRDLRVVDAASVAAGIGTGERAVPRNVRTRPGPGDTTPELRSDPATAVPFPTARRRYDRPAGREGSPEETARRTRPTPAQAAPAPAEDPPPAQAAPPANAAPDVARPFPWTARPRPGRNRERNAEGAPEPAAPGADRDVMRPVFQPLSRSRPDGERNRGDRGDAGASEGEAPGARRRGGARGDDGAFRARAPQSPSSAPADRSASRPERSDPRPERSAPRAEPRRERPSGASGGARSGGGDHATRRKRDN